MRIIAGVAKGRNLAPVAGATRPTSDRAREALFSTLLSEFGDFENLKFLDLYAGSAAVGLEALSRGASIVHAVENDEGAVKTIRNNHEIIQSSKPSGAFKLYSMSANKFLTNCEDSYDIIFMDPPYDVTDKVVQDLVELISKKKIIKSGGVLVIERATKRERNSSPFQWPSPFKEFALGTPFCSSV